jgi:hypothetical protein
MVSICENYPGCVLLFERLRKMKPGAMSQSRRLNRKQANQLKGKIRDYAQDKAYAVGVVSCEVNAHHSFWREWHWHPRKKPTPKKLIAGEARRPVRLEVGWEKDGEGKPADPSQARLQTSRHGT